MKPLISINCPECGNDMWNTREWESIAECTNCRFERPFYPRMRGTEITPSQKRSIKKVRDFFLDYGRVKELETFDVKNVEGTVWVSVYTHGPTLRCRGAHIQIGRRGGIRVAGIHGGIHTVGPEAKKTARFYAKMLGGKLLDWAWED